MKCEHLMTRPLGLFTHCLLSLPSDDARLFGYVRIKTGDTMSKRAKFTLITWVGQNVGGLQLAKISTDKAVVKEIVQVRDRMQNMAIKALGVTISVT